MPEEKGAYPQRRREDGVMLELRPSQGGKGPNRWYRTDREIVRAVKIAVKGPFGGADGAHHPINPPKPSDMARLHAQRNAARARGDTHAANRATEQLGDLMADGYMRQQYPNAECIHQGRGSGTFDRVYKNNSPPPDLIIVEAKGGAGTNSSSRMGRDGQHYQQGHPDYRESVTDAMARGGGTDKVAAEALQTRGANFEYIEIRQPIRNDGSLGELRVAHYDQTI